MKKMDAGLYVVRRMQRLELRIEEMTEVLMLAKQAIIWLAEGSSHSTPAPRSDIVTRIDKVLSNTTRQQPQ